MMFPKLNKKTFMYTTSEKYISKRLNDDTGSDPSQKITQVAATGIASKRLLPIVVALVGFVGLLLYVSQTYQPKSQPVSPPLPNKALIQAVYDNLRNLADPSVAAQYFSPTFQYHITDGETTLHGLEGLQGLFEIYRSVYPYDKASIKSIISVDETVVTRWSKMMISNAYFDLDTDSRSAEPELVRGTTIWRISDGKIAEAWIILDR